MAEFKYTLSAADAATTARLSGEDSSLSGAVTLNSSFRVQTDYVEIDVFDKADNFLGQYPGNSQLRELLNSNSANQEGVSTIYLDPLSFSKAQFPGQSTRIQYNFLRRLSSEQLYVSGISPDRLEIKLTPLQGTVDSLHTELVDKFNSSTYIPKLLLEFSATYKVLVVNIDRDGQELLLKLYSPLELPFGLKSQIRLLEEIADSVSYTINVSTTVTPTAPPVLRGPNFSIELEDQSDLTTEYLDYTELFSYPVTGSYNRIFSEISGSEVNINVDYTAFENFVHFSSAKERLVNFKYKLDLIQSYEAAKISNAAIINASSSTTAASLKYDNLIKGILSNFDGYERHLYFESSSTSWPKLSSTLPYENELSTAVPVIDWFENTLTSASLFDELNESRLTYTIPEYIRQDDNNDPYSLFIDMIGQHFDNLWIYAKGFTDKYDADNRLDYGVSKDLIVKTLQNFGVKLYSSNFSAANLSKLLLGEWYDSGSEDINLFVTASNDPTPDSDILNETYKRIYHNLPYLLKTKGTERGLRALINCFGIPSGSIQIREYGGLTNQLDFNPGLDYPAQHEEKIRLDNTGSLIPGNTLSYYTSILKPKETYTQDLHVVEVGFSPSYYIDEYIVNYTLPPNYVAGTVLTDVFAHPNYRIDDYIGDPRNINKRQHTELNILRDRLLSKLEQYDVYDFVRLIKFFDNQLFKMIKDFTPARDTVSTGVIIKPHLLDRSKTGEPVIGASRSEFTASIDTAFIEGSEPGVIGDFSVAHSESISTTLGYVNEINDTEEEKFTGELGGTSLIVTTGELNKDNPFKQIHQPYCTYSVTQYLDNDGITELSYLYGYPISPGNISIFWGETATGANFVKYIKIHFTPGTGTADFTTSFRSGVNSIKIGNNTYTPDSITVGSAAALLTFNTGKTAAFALNPGAYPITTTEAVLITPYVFARFDNSDYNALLNNASIVDTATTLQKVDYSNGITPSNIEAIRNNTAAQADVQEYLHNSFGMRSGRYLGKQLTCAAINEYTFGDKSYGQVPVIESTDVYFGYFRWIENTSPLLGNHIEGKGHVKLWYLIDENGDLTTLGKDKEGVTLSKVQQTFKEGSLANITLDSSATGDFATLNKDWTTLKSGKRVTPILYSQTASFDSNGTIVGLGATSKLNFKSDDIPNTLDPSVTTDMRLTAPAITGQTIKNSLIPFNVEFNPASTGYIGDDASLHSSGEYFTFEPADSNIPFTLTFNVRIAIDWYTLYKYIVTYEIQKSTDTINWVTIHTKDINHKKDSSDFVTLYSVQDTIVDTSGTDKFHYRLAVTALDGHWLAGTVKLTSGTRMQVTQSPINANFTETFWTPDTTNRQYLSASLATAANPGLDEFYGQTQVDIEESGLPKINLPFILQSGDEIRFEGTETQTYIIQNVQESPSLILELDRPINVGVDTNYFLVRRYVDDPSYLILDIPDATDGTSPGVVRTQYPAPGIKNSIDTIVAKLKSENSF